MRSEIRKYHSEVFARGLPWRLGTQMPRSSMPSRFKSPATGRSVKPLTGPPIDQRIVGLAIAIGVEVERVEAGIVGGQVVAAVAVEIADDRIAPHVAGNLQIEQLVVAVRCPDTSSRRRTGRFRRPDGWEQSRPPRQWR